MLLLPILISLLKNTKTSATCPCENESLCNPVQLVRDKEIFGFGQGNWKNYDWDVVTTVAWANDQDMMCHAHSKNVRMIAAAPQNMPLTNNKTKRKAWIETAVTMVENLHLDGITFDYESPILHNSPERDYYTQLVNETTQTFHERIPGSQISVCVAWSPNNIDGRAYDWVGLSDASDLLYVMVYDTRSQIYGRCIASANSPTQVAELGISQFLDLGISPNKLIMGLPWYGYDYPCIDMESKTSKFCPIQEIPFRGVNCSDAAGGERSFSDIMSQVNAGNMTGDLQWDALLQSWYFNYQGRDGVHQVWFDDNKSLYFKYQVAKKFGIRGTGPYRFDQLSYNTEKEKQESAAMWKAIASFLK